MVQNSDSLAAGLLGEMCWRWFAGLQAKWHQLETACLATAMLVSVDMT